MNKETAVRQAIEDRENYRGVEALAFHRFESNAQYHAIGVFRAHGELIARSASDSFSSRVPETPKMLYLGNPLSEESEQAHAASIMRRYNDLPVVLESLLRQAAGLVGGVSMRYQIRAILDAEMSSIGKVVGEANTLAEAQDAASAESTYPWGVAIVDTVAGTVDFGADEEGQPLVRPLDEVAVRGGK